MKKIIVLCMLVVALATANASCANNSDTKNSTTNNNATTVAGEQSGENNQTPDEANGTEAENPEQAKDPAYVYGGEQIDFKGENFVIAYPDWGLYSDYSFAEELNGDKLNDALYQRTKDVEDFFNVKIVTRMTGDYGTPAMAVSKDVQAGLGEIDIALLHCISGLNSLVSSNMAYNWNKMPNVDFSKKYWNSTMNQYLSIENYMPYAANDFIIADPCFMTFNKTLWQNNSLENPYELVKNGKWTWDKLSDMAKVVSADLNGNQVSDVEDQYGFAVELDWMCSAIMYSCNQRIVERGEDGRYVTAIGGEHMVGIIQKLYSLFKENNTSFTWAYSDGPNKRIAFDTGRVLFYINAGSDIKNLRSTDLNFGILPLPKYDENQKDYVSLNWAGVICAPINIKNPEKVGAVVEYLGALSHESVLPAYFDILLNGKVARDDESVAMLDIIFGDCTYDFGLNFGEMNKFQYTVSEIMKAKSPDLISFYEKNNAKIQSNYDNTYDKFIENAGN